jgi:hypothetical protein
LYTLYGLYISATGGSWLENRKYFTVYFRSNKTTNVAQARPLLITVADKFITKLNQHDQLKKALEHEFTLDNIEVVLLFDHSSKEFDVKKHLTNARIGKKNLLSYKTYSKISDPYQIIKEETYEEALQILNQSKNEK